jgi:hypothetical protein
MHSITQGMLEETWEELTYLLDILLTTYGAQVEATGSNDRQKNSMSVILMQVSVFYLL